MFEGDKRVAGFDETEEEVGIKKGRLERKNVSSKSKSDSSQEASVSSILNENYLKDSSEMERNPRNMKGPPSSTSFFLVSEDVFTKWQRITSEIFRRLYDIVSQLVSAMSTGSAPIRTSCSCRG